MKQQTDQPIVLHRKAPWDKNLYRWGTRYIQVGDRKFTAELGDGIWSVWEVDETGLPVGWRDRNISGSFVAHAFNQAQVRVAIRMRLNAATEDEIRKAVHNTPRQGTGRNHPRNVAYRRSH